MGADRQRDTKLAEVFIMELQQAEAKDECWDFIMMLLGQNHADGIDCRPTHSNGVDRDLARGMMIEAD
jgi:hypothetical protein